MLPRNKKNKKKNKNKKTKNVIHSTETHVSSESNLISNNNRNPFVNHRQKLPDQVDEWNPERINEKLKQHYGSGLMIKRLFYRDYPMFIDKHYINLSILQGGAYQQKLDECARETAIRKDVEEVYDYAIQLYGQESVYAPEDIFFIALGGLEKKILILGTAGIGKSTLSEYLCYLWASLNVDLPKFHLLKGYRWVFRIPLRNLTVESYPSNQSYGLIDIIEKECLAPVFKKTGPFLSVQDKNQLETELSEANDRQEVLLIVDGFDEISEHSTPEILLLIRELLKFKQLIVTSRPYNLFELRQTYQFREDLSFEITGFKQQDIEVYVKNFFTYLPFPKPEEGKKFLDFLVRNKNIAGACRIPINLELLCSAWDKQPIPQGSYSMTTIYELVTNSLCRRHLERQGEKIRDKDDGAILEMCELPLAFLEHLGYQSVYESKLFFKLDVTRKYMMKESVEDNFIACQKQFGFIQPNNPLGEYDGASPYYFNHLTFRDYFAARFFGACLQKVSFSQAQKICHFEHQWPFPNEENLDFFLKQHCFDQRYEFIWWFIVGLLDSARDKRSLNHFFSLLLTEGHASEIARVLLLIRCVDEVKELSHELPKGILEYIIQWLNLSLEPFLNLMLIGDQSPLIERFKISPSVFNHDKVQSFFYRKIQDSDLVKLIKILDFFRRVQHPLSERVQEAIIQQSFLVQTFEEENVGFNLHFANLLNKLSSQLACLCSLKCLSVKPFVNFFNNTDSSSEQFAISIMVLLQCKFFSLGDNANSFKKRIYDIFVSEEQPVLVRCAAATLLGAHHQLGSFLILAKKDGHYEKLQLMNCFVWQDLNFNIMIVHANLIQAMQAHHSLLDFDLIDIAQKSGIDLYFPEFFARSFLIPKEASLHERLNGFYRWLLSLKKTSTSIDLVTAEPVLEKFSDLLKEPNIEIERELFLNKLEQLCSPAMPIVLPIFNEIRARLVMIFINQWHSISAPSIKKYIAVHLVSYSKVGTKRYKEALNFIMNNAYSDEEIALLVPFVLKAANLTNSSFMLVYELVFCHQDCALYLKDLNFNEKTNIFSLFLLLNKTPADSILDFCLENIMNPMVIKPLLAVLILRHIQLGKAFYVNEEGMCYFEYRKNQVIFLSDPQKQIFRETIKSLLDEMVKVSLPQFNVGPIQSSEKNLLLEKNSQIKLAKNTTNFFSKKENSIARVKFKKESSQSTNIIQKKTKVSPGALAAIFKRLEFVLFGIQSEINNYQNFGKRFDATVGANYVFFKKSILDLLEDNENSIHQVLSEVFVALSSHQEGKNVNKRALESIMFQLQETQEELQEKYQQLQTDVLNSQLKKIDIDKIKRFCKFMLESCETLTDFTSEISPSKEQLLYELRLSVARQQITRLQEEKSFKRPSCFISYAWGDAFDEQRVEVLVKDFRLGGFEVVYDKSDNKSASVPAFVAKIQSVDFVILIATPEIVEKWSNFSTEGASRGQTDENYHGNVVTQEMSLIWERICSRANGKSDVLIVPWTSTKYAIPDILKPLANGHLNFTQLVDYPANLFRLLEEVTKRFESCCNVVKQCKNDYETLVQDYQTKTKQEIREILELNVAESAFQRSSLSIAPHSAFYASVNPSSQNKNAPNQVLQQFQFGSKK